MANRIVVDPITRIEGHLRIEVEVKDGKVTGQPELLKSDLGEIEPVGMDRKGDLFYTTSIAIEEVRIAELEFTTGKLLAAPRLVDLPSAASNGKANLSPDGNYLIYRSGVKDPVACRLDLRTWKVEEIKDSNDMSKPFAARPKKKGKKRSTKGKSLSGVQGREAKGYCTWKGF